MIINPYTLFNGLLIPAELKLSSKGSYLLWKQYLVHTAEGVSTEFGNFVKGENPNLSYNVSTIIFRIPFWI